MFPEYISCKVRYNRLKEKKKKDYKEKNYYKNVDSPTMFVLLLFYFRINRSDYQTVIFLLLFLNFTILYWFCQISK